MNEPDRTRLVIDDRPLLLLPQLALALGVNEALVLQQLHYWLSHYEQLRDARHFYNGRYWIYNSYQQWRDHFPFWSERTLRTVFRSLEQPFTPAHDDARLARGPLVLTGNYNREFRGNAWDRTKWYTIDQDELALLTLAISNRQDLPEGPGDSRQLDQSAADGSCSETTGSEKTDSETTPTVGYGAAGPSGGVGMKGGEGKGKPDTPNRRKLDMEFALTWYLGSPPTPGNVRKAEHVVGIYLDRLNYRVTQRDLNATAVNARYWWNQNRPGNPRGLEAFQISLKDTLEEPVIAPFVTQHNHETVESKPSKLPDLLTPLTELLGRLPTYAEVATVLEFSTRYAEGGKYITQTGFDNAAQYTPSWTSKRTVDAYIDVLRQLLAQE